MLESRMIFTPEHISKIENLKKLVKKYLKFVMGSLENA